MRNTLLFFGLMLAMMSYGQNDQDRQMIRNFFDDALTEKQSYLWLEDLCEIGPRLSGSKASLDAIHWVKSVMDTCGFDTAYLQPVMVPHWERGAKEKATLTDKNGNSYELSVLAIGGSVGTPGTGIKGQVVEVQTIDDLELLSEDEVKGKFVFYNPTFDQRNISTGSSYGANVIVRARGAVAAAKKGAIGSLIRSVSSSYDDAPHTGTGNYEEGIDSIPAAALGVQSAEKLHDILALDPTATIDLSMHCQWFDDAPSYNVIAEVRGSEFPDEIIVMGGHLDSWDVSDGAHDDGAGCMHSLGALKLIVDQGVQPKRTIRAVMFINEENGTRGGIAYADSALAKNEKHIAAIESDAGGFSPRGFGMTASDDKRLKVESFLSLFPRNTISYISKGGGGVDIGPLHRADGTPMLGLIVDGQKMFDLHHSPNDVFETVHFRELELGTATMAGMIYLLDQYGL